MRKPLHKHIAHHVKKFHGHFTKYLYERDTILATAWVFTFILLVKILPMPNLHFFDPMKLALEDFDINDITYSKLKGPDKFDNRIVIINIGHADREGLAYIIEKAASMNPKVIGLDVYFEGPKESYKDSLLKTVFEKAKNLVAISRIEWNHHGEGKFLNDYYDSTHSLTGYGNITGEEGGTIRNFSPYEKINDSIHYSFSAMLVKQYSTEAFKKLKKRHDHNEIINYTRRNNQYLHFTAEELLNDGVDESALKGKIVLLGYLSEDENDIEDKVFTPTNEKFAGKSRPDMNGIVVHANIISMILDHNYIKKLPSWVNIVVAILIGWLHMSFFIRYYLEDHIWFHLVAKFAQLLSAVFFVYVGIFLFDKFNMKLDMSLTLVVIILAVDIIYFYEAFAVWMHKKFGYTTVFHQKHHSI
jgi:CHASE2 domain-containing sensor protein